MNKRTIKKSLSEFSGKITLIMNELEEFKDEIEEYNQSIEPYEGKDDLTEEQYARQEWLEDVIYQLEDIISNLDDNQCQLDEMAEVE